MEVSRLGDGHRGSARGETDCQGSCSEILYAQEYNTRPLQFEGQGSSRPGPAPVLTVKGEKELVQWIIKMAEIGYGQCRQQVTTMVKKYWIPITGLTLFLITSRLKTGGMLF